jgi:hypothetical protein
MSKIKIIELVLIAAATLIEAMKAIIKFIGYVGKLKKKPKTV